MFSHLVLLTGMPRSGTSWLSQIFDSSPEVCFRLSPLFSYEFKNQASETSDLADWLRIFEGAYESQNEFMLQSTRRQQGSYPKFSEKSADPQWLVVKDTRFHNLTGRLLRLFENIKVVALVRHPCGAINSWLKSPNEFPSNAKPRQEWRTGACRKTGYGEFWGFNDWIKVTEMHLRLEQEFPKNVYVQTYKDLVLSAESVARNLFKFCEIPFSKQSAEFIEQSQKMHNPDQYAVFKNSSVLDSWKSELSSEIQEEIYNELSGTSLERFLS